MLLTVEKTAALLAMVNRCETVLEVELLDDLIRRELNIPMHLSNFDVIENYGKCSSYLTQIQTAVADKLLELTDLTDGF